MFSLLTYIKWALVLAAFIVVGFLLSLGIEIAGFFMGWWDQHHVPEMIQKELGYLNLSTSLIAGVPTPVETAKSYLEMLSLFGLTANDISEQLTIRQSSPLLIWFLSNVMAMVALYGVKLIVCCYSLTLLTVFVLIAINEGFLSRHLRKLGGGAESSWKFHKFKRSIKPTFASGWGIYLMTPFSIHPNYILATMSLIFALLLFGMISNWKKLT